MLLSFWYTVGQRVHQDVDFKCLSNIAIKGIFIKPFIKSIQADIPCSKILLIKYSLRKVDKDLKHPLLHDIEIETEGHPHHDVSVDFSLQE